MDIETFAHIVAHDMKAPLNGIASMVDFVVEDYGDRLDDEGREQLRLIQQMAVRGVAMVDGLRRFSRVASAPVQLRRLDLTAMAGRAVARSAALAPDATVRPRVAALPAVLGDPALVADVLTTLTDNAVLFHQGAVIGIDPRFHDAVFEMFKRLHAADRFGGGVGAGLAVARAIVERHGGRLWIAHSSPAGTTVAFTLPAAPAEA